MAQKRMFSKDVIDNEKFYSLPFNSQLLYFHLGLNADVKGFVQPQKIIRLVGLRIDDLIPLIEKRYLIPFDSGVVVVTHWKINNNLREDRESETIFLEELHQLDTSGKVYLSLPEYSGSSPAQVRLGEVRLDQDNIGGFGNPPEAEASGKEATNNKNEKEGSTKAHTDSINSTYTLAEFVEFFNSVKKSKYQPKKELKSSFISRIRDGYTKVDFETAILNAYEVYKERERTQVVQWTYLTPELLLRPSKFEMYLNVPGKSPSDRQAKLDQQHLREENARLEQEKQIRGKAEEEERLKDPEYLKQQKELAKASQIKMVDTKLKLQGWKIDDPEYDRIRNQKLKDLNLI